MARFLLLRPHTRIPFPIHSPYSSVRGAILLESHYRARGRANESARDFIHVAQRGGELHGGAVVLEGVHVLKSRAISFARRFRYVDYNSEID